MEQISPLLQARIEQQQAYQTQNNTNPFVLNPRVDIGGAKLQQLVRRLGETQQYMYLKPALCVS